MISKTTVRVVWALIGLITVLSPARAQTDALATPYTDPAQYTRVPFGAHSHWLQPWRAYLQTVPAETFINGVGVGLTLNGASPDLVMEMLARHGVRRTRIEINWPYVNFDDESRINDNDGSLRAKLVACKKFGVRPVILLNAHQGIPCPLQMFERRVTQEAHKGDTTVTLDHVDGLKIGYSGLSNLTDYWAAEALITRIDGNTVTLSKPLPKEIKAGAAVPMATLKYRPFSPPDGEDYKATVAGWQRYTGTVAQFVANVLGTTQSADRGFDMEIWNELTFGDEFLYINHYYADKPYRYPAGTDENSIWTNLVKETAAYVDAHPADFQGVVFNDGFANTIPWPAASKEPARIGAIGKHPYFGRKHYPQDQPKGGANLNALKQEENPATFVPSYDAFFPEYWATALQTETLVRDMGPITFDIYRVPHGENSRVIDGKVVPCTVWFTECNVDPIEDNPAITPQQALALKAKSNARTYCFYLGKGVTNIDLYAAASNDVKAGDKELGIVQANFLDYARQPGAVYPADDRTYTSPILAVTGRIVAKMREGLDPHLIETRPISVVSITDTHNHFQFTGDGTPAHPTLYDRDVFALTPFQVNARRFVIPYYVMTRDIEKDLAPEQFTIELKGLNGKGASITAYDPFKAKVVPVGVRKRLSDRVSLQLTATDYPCLLIVQEK